MAKECADLVKFGLAMSNTSVICVGTNPTCHVSDSTEQCEQGSHRLGKIFVHDFSMTISQFSMTVSLLNFVFATLTSENADFLPFCLLF